MVISAVAGLIPKIEGFAPLPAASADAFMAMQGGHMALYFGAMYQFSKRLVASQTNEKFNSMASNPSELTNMLEPHYKEITRAFTNHLSNDVDRIQELVLDKAYKLEILKIHQNVKLLKELPSAYWEAIFDTSQKIEQADRTPTTSGGRSPGSQAGSITPGTAPPIIAPRPPTTSGGRTPGSSTQPVSQQSAEKALVLQLKAKTDSIAKSIETLKKNNYYGAGKYNPAIAPLLVKLNAQLKQAGVNYSKKAQDYKNKYGVWI